MTRRQILRWLRRAGPFTVESCSDGTLRVEPEWPGEPKPGEEFDGSPGGPGVITRMTVATALDELLAVLVLPRKVNR